MSGKGIAVTQNKHHFPDAGKMIGLGSGDLFVGVNKMVFIRFGCVNFDGEQLTDLMGPLGLGWRERREKELALMDDLVPLLKRRAGGRTISGLGAYEQ